jgi:hypothetical protein
MATEDIRVEHQASAETACFDIKNRCLILPVWKDMSNSMYDMLVAHEVSHALNTPFQEWEDARKTVVNEAAFMQVANVVEDARIERMIKETYPGIRKDFARAYGELHTSDLFELADKNISELSLIDRLNIEFKLGLFGHVQVPFSADEKTYVTRMANTKTFADVIVLAKELLTDWELNQDQKQQDGENGDSGDGEKSQQGQDSMGKGQGSMGDGEESQQGSDEDDNDSPMETPNIDDINGDDQKQEDETSSDSDGDDSDGDDSDGESGQDDSSYNYDDYTNNSGGDLPSQTQSAFEKGKKDLADGEANKRDYCTLPTKMNLDKIIIDFDAVNAIWEEYEKGIALVSDNNTDWDSSSTQQQANRRVSFYNEAVNNTAIELDKFLSAKKAVVNHMVSQFQMKQSADADRRTSIAKSGVLDTTAMMGYKWNEEIFANNEVISDGKNHGMIFFLDWSGSMGSIIKDTIEQLIILTEFCNKVSIPFEVYAFSDRDDLVTLGDDESQYEVKAGASGQIRPHTFSLINFVSSKMNKKDYKTATQRLLHLASSAYGSTPRKFQMGCTPLNEAVVSAFDIVPKFQDETGVQIVNAVFLTDGQGHGMGARGGYYCDAYVHDPVTHRDYKVEGRDETNLYLEILKERTGCNTVGIYLTSSKHIANERYSYLNDTDLVTAVATWKKSNFAVASDDKTGYDECYIIKGNIGGDDDALDNLDHDASYSKIRNAFAKSSNNNKTNKIIATKMIEVFASTLVK